PERRAPLQRLAADVGEAPEEPALRDEGPAADPGLEIGILDHVGRARDEPGRGERLFLARLPTDRGQLQETRSTLPGIPPRDTRGAVAKIDRPPGHGPPARSALAGRRGQPPRSPVRWRRLASAARGRTAARTRGRWPHGSRARAARPSRPGARGSGSRRGAPGASPAAPVPPSGPPCRATRRGSLPPLR